MKKIIIMVATLATLTIGVFYFISQSMKRMQEDADLTKQLSPTLLEQLKGKHAFDFPYNPAPIEWDEKYLQIDHAVVETENYSYLNFRYNKERNDKLNVSRFFSDNDINGIVWIYTDFKVLGEYTGGGQASQPYYVLYFIDLKKQAILAQDTLWGGMPPQTISSGANGGVGNLPKEEEIIKAIQDRVK